jgi:hypothetical protein
VIIIITMATTTARQNEEMMNILLPATPDYLIVIVTSGRYFLHISATVVIEVGQERSKGDTDLFFVDNNELLVRSSR